LDKHGNYNLVTKKNITTIASAAFLFAGCSLTTPYTGRIAIEPVGGLIYTYPAPPQLVLPLVVIPPPVK